MKAHERLRLLDSVSSSEIINLWHVCGSQYRDPLDRALPVRQLMPRSASKVVTYQGIVALPGEGLLPVTQIFYWEGPVLRSRSELRGRYDGKARSLLWNAHVSLQTMLGTTELCDLMLEHANRSRCAAASGVVERGRLAYGRALGPGCLVLQAYVEQAGKPQCWPPAYVLLMRDSDA